MSKKILVTGGAGYIGSHVLIYLIASGYEVIVVDNLSNSSIKSIKRVECITGASVKFVKGDIRDRALLIGVFESNDIIAVMHFAGMKSVSESVLIPLCYYDNNVYGSIALLEVMADFGCKKIIFSSSAAVYGNPISVPIKKNFMLSATNPYGESKLVVEKVLRDLYISDKSWSIGILRYFNPVGAHESGLIGEDPKGVPNNLVPFITQVAAGVREYLLIFGGDYNTLDGTGVRDYIHVVDLSKGHVAALGKLLESKGLFAVNLGTGRGFSVLEMVKEFEKVTGKKIPYKIVGRREGDVAECYADPEYAFDLFGWKASLGLERMCKDSWYWQCNNPNGYND